MGVMYQASMIPARLLMLFRATAILSLSPPLDAAEHRVWSASAILKLAPELKPGDAVVLENGVWQDQSIVFEAKGTAENPVSLRAETAGKVILTGKSTLRVTGEHVVVSGLNFTNGHTATDGILIAGRHCRLTESAVMDSTYKFFVHLDGSDNRVDHCYLAGKTSESPTFQIEVGSKPNHHLVDHNHFGPRPPLGRNGGETMRVGYSWQSMSNSSSVVEHNLFDRCDGEIEIISSKSCDNVYRNNTFLDCAGMLTLRHGNRCRVEGNFFIAHHKRGSGGIRIIGEDHVIVNNYIEGVAQGAFWITSGIVDSPLKGYFCARHGVIAFNTVVDSAGPYLDLSAGIGSANRTLLPENITVANNVFAVPAGGAALLKGRRTDSYHWLNNFAGFSGAPASELPKGIRSEDPKLLRGADGLMRPDEDSPLRGAGVPLAALVVTNDIDGQPRGKSLDAGCDQISGAPVKNQPMTAAETGPVWLKRTTAKLP
jgi:poly(beta-D-mannuronate) lyase